MRLRHIEVFRALMLTGTASEAARMLSISQPAVSRTLQHAELQLGFKLFQRSRGRLLPTPEAQALFANVARAFDELDRVKRMSGNLRRGGVGRICIASTPSLSHNVLPLAMSYLLRKHPDAHCEVWVHHSNQIVAGLLSHELDVGFAFDPKPHEGIVQETFAEGEIVLISPQRKPARGSSRALPELAHERFIVLSDETSLGYLFNRACERAGVDLQSSITVQTYHIARALVEQGLGNAVVDQYTAVSGEPRGLRIQTLEPSLRFAVTLMHNAHRPLSVLARSMITSMTRAEMEIRGQLSGWLNGSSRTSDRGFT